MAKHEQKTQETKQTETTEVVETRTPVIHETVGATALAVQPEAAPLQYDPVKLAACKNTSEKIRYLHSTGMKNGPIAKLLGKRYQHVRNVLVVPVKKPV